MGEKGTKEGWREGHVFGTLPGLDYKGKLAGGKLGEAIGRGARQVGTHQWGPYLACQ